MTDFPAFPWDVLGIAPTTDAKLIRAAYATRLKQIEPRTDPAAFQRLRSAYELAMRFGVPMQTTVPVAARRNEAVAEITALLDAGNTLAAARRLAEADASTLTFDDLATIEERLLVQAPDLPRGPLLALVHRFDWDHAIHPLRSRHGKVFVQLDQRLLLEQWHAELERARPHSFVAAVLLKGPPVWHDYLFACWRLMLASNRTAVTGWLNRIERAPRAGEVFDPARLRWCRRWLQPWRLYALIVGGFSLGSPIAAMSQGEIATAFLAWTISVVTLALVWGIVMLLTRGLRRLGAAARFLVRALWRWRPR